jgi:hypothetical protein
MGIQEADKTVDNIRLEMERTLGLPKEEWVGDGNPTKDEKWVSKKPTRRLCMAVFNKQGQAKKWSP